MRTKNKSFVFFSALVSLFSWQAQPIFANDTEKFRDEYSAPPRFENFPARVLHSQSSPKLVLTTKLARRYKTAIRNEAARPVNFAGHFRVATWGCGTDCRGFAIINKRTGIVYTAPGAEFVAGVMGNDDDRLEFRADSNLIVIAGLKNEEEEGKFYFLWKQGKLHLLAKRPLIKKEIDPNAW